MEADMSVCHLCGANLVALQGRMDCPNIRCPFVGYEIPKKIPSQAELLKENKQLKQKIIEMENFRAPF